MLNQETAFGSSQPPWMMNSGWAWVVDQEEINLTRSGSRSAAVEQAMSEAREGAKLSRRHIKLARDFIASNIGQLALGASGYLPTAASRKFESRQKAICDIMIALHLFREEQKLDVTLVDSLNAGTPTLTPVMAQISKWLGWSKWVDFYEVEDAAIDCSDYESCMLQMLRVSEATNSMSSKNHGFHSAY
jgi:anaphase-promoting complex subunit 1